MDKDRSGEVSFKEMYSYLRQGAAATLDSMRLAAAAAKRRSRPAKKHGHSIASALEGAVEEEEPDEADVGQECVPLPHNEDEDAQIAPACTASVTSVEDEHHSERAPKMNLSDAALADDGSAPPSEQGRADDELVATRKPLSRYVSYRGVPEAKHDDGDTEDPPGPASAGGPASGDHAGTSTADDRRKRLLELKALMEEGLIDAEDFQAQKSRILGQI